jgi:ribA/ribD-fused uncharacterized protein
MNEDIIRFDNEYNYLDNFFKCKINYEGIVYPSCNHAYQAAKVLDVNAKILISQIPEHSKLYMVVDRYPEKYNWEDIKLDVMTDIVRSKFNQHPELKSNLLETGQAHIEYGNSLDDSYWGISPINSGMGLNNLGLILMELREEFELEKNNDK